MRTIPLGGKKAAGRVTLVGDGDYELASQHAWHVRETKATPNRRARGPYAVTNVRKADGSGWTELRMHMLITGWPLTDHVNHDTLDNRRENLRPATRAENARNSLGLITRKSRYKGMTWLPKRGQWRAAIRYEGRLRTLGHFATELEAAYAYDAAARELHGEFACTNFADEPTQAMRDEWAAENAARNAAVESARVQKIVNTRAAMWLQRPLEAVTCVICGDTFHSRSPGARYCGDGCAKESKRRRVAAARAARRERLREGWLF